MAHEKAIDPQAPHRAFAQDLRDLRDSAGLNSAELARAAHLSPSTVTRALKGETCPSWEVTRAIVRACKASTGTWQSYWEEARRDGRQRAKAARARVEQAARPKTEPPPTPPTTATPAASPTAGMSAARMATTPATAEEYIAWLEQNRGSLVEARENTQPRGGSPAELPARSSIRPHTSRVFWDPHTRTYVIDQEGIDRGEGQGRGRHRKRRASRFIGGESRPDRTRRAPATPEQGPINLSASEDTRAELAVELAFAVGCQPAGRVSLLAFILGTPIMLGVRAWMDPIGRHVGDAALSAALSGDLSGAVGVLLGGVPASTILLGGVLLVACGLVLLGITGPLGDTPVQTWRWAPAFVAVQIGLVIGSHALSAQLWG
jgi:transcriptional regulator with XRE-family HTH domain